MAAGDILIVGGYGVVGRRIAAHLVRRFPDRVVISGRNERRADALCRELGHGARARRIDVDDVATIGPALDGAGTVMTCVASADLHLLRASIACGVGYTDIAPRLAFWRGAEEMASEARRTGARIVLGAGLSPGISNMMAQRLAKAVGRMDHIETAILLSLGDEYGPDSLHHVLEALTQRFEVTEHGRKHEAVPFSAGRRVQFPEPIGSRTAYLFPWSDVVYYPRTLGARTSLGRFAIEPAWVGGLAALLVRAGARRWLHHPGFFRGNRGAIDGLRRVYAGHDRFALIVEVRGSGGVMTMSFAGRNQADATAAGAAEVARALAEGEVAQPGVWLPEEVLSSECFFEALTSQGWKVGAAGPVFDHSGSTSRIASRNRADVGDEGSVSGG